MSELVTGEAVALELRPAKLPSRGLAVLIDLAVVWAVYLGVTVGIVASTSSLDDAAAAAVAVASFVLILVGGPIAVETLSHGRSLGKMACGLRVVRDDGGPIRFRHALVRGAVGVIEILLTFGVVACIASLVSARGRRLGDVFAGTLVVRERVPTGEAAFIPPPPPWLAGRFSELDLSGVPEGLWLAIRQYLTRMGQLDPQVGWAMAERLAGDLAERTGAPAPQGVPPAAYLAAVVQERQARDARRAFGGGQAAPPAHAGPGAVAGYPGGGGSVGPVSIPAYPSYPVGAAEAVGRQEPQEPRDAGPVAGRDGAEGSSPGTGFVPPA
ncbi:membrane protein [Streptomyces longisporoflavus]|uniref:RDD family protein n=1 Tax=Streptomyces longisporoflavus TaxID=28044 RepID=UPI00167C7242|nr:RDD family protein [Streptomyces longisporoflavus]GGV52190.1 membrane protein [Streptomyces longisporoflavus]